MRILLVPCVLIAVALIGYGGFLVREYGNARYATGVADANAKHATAQATATTQAVQELEEIIHDSNTKPMDTIERGLSDLGILRSSEDR